jgi:hypothetical protein
MCCQSFSGQNLQMVQLAIMNVLYKVKTLSWQMPSSPTLKIAKSVPDIAYGKYRLNLAVQGEVPCFLICFLNETMLVFNL